MTEDLDRLDDLLVVADVIERLTTGEGISPGPWHPVRSGDPAAYSWWLDNAAGDSSFPDPEDVATIVNRADPATIRSLVADSRERDELRAALDETQRMLEYLWSATGSRAPDMPVYDLFNEDDPITDDILTVLGRARMLVHGATPAPRTALHPGDGT